MKSFAIKSILLFNQCIQRSIQSRRMFSEISQSTKPLFCDNIQKLNVKNALLAKPSPQLVSVSGWIRSTRKQKPVFLHVNDGSVHNHLQVVIDDEDIQTRAKDLHNGCCVRCVGRLVDSPGPKQPVELLCQSMQVLGECDPNTYPFAQRNSSYKMPYFRDYLHLRARHMLFGSMARIRSQTINAIHIHMNQNDFINITTPVITSNDCEGAGSVFTVRSPFCSENNLYFDKQTYLTVSAQLHLEAMASALSRVYTINECFRAEKSLSRKHLTEFLMFECEEAFVESVDELMDRVESVCKFIAYYIQHNCAEDLNNVHKENNYKYFDKIANSKYIRMTYKESIEILNKFKKYSDLKIGQNLNAEQEKVLVEYTDNTPVFVTHFPSNIKPFYMKRLNEQALCFDLLSPICGEVCGGSLREDSLTELEQRIKEFQSIDSLEWYLDLRRFGNTSLGGFGIGFDRLIQTMTGMLNIRDVSAFPRYLHNCRL